MKNITKNSLIFLGSIAAGVAIGVGIFFIANKLINNNSNNDSNSKNSINKIYIKNKEKRGDVGAEIKKDYKNNQNIHLVEYKYKNKTFLGEEGLQKLNQIINQKLPFGSEVDQLKSITFNDTYSLPENEDEINGQYNNFTMKIDIDLRRFINNRRFENTSLDSRVDWVYSIILHEYGHHLANSYITSIRYDDEQNININKEKSQQMYSSTSLKGIYSNKNIPTLFYKNWSTSLNYNNEDLSLIEKNFFKKNVKYFFEKYPRDFIPLSSNELFNCSNFPIINNQQISIMKNNPNLLRIGRMNNKKTFEVNLNNLMTYNYGIDELLTRQMVSFNFIPNNWNDYLFFLDNSNSFGTNEFSFNSFAPDVLLRNNINVKLTNNKFDYNINNFQIFTADNIFGGFLDGNEIIPQYNELNYAYKNVFGYGKLINQIYFNNSNNYFEIDNNDKDYLIRNHLDKNDFKKIKISGYLPKDSKIKGLVLVLSDKTNHIVKFENIFKTSELKTKTKIFDETYYNNNDLYNQYISEEIDLNKFNNIQEIKYWNDLNNNNELDATNYSDSSNELKSFSKIDITNERPITTFREALESNIYGVSNNEVNMPTGSQIVASSEDVKNAPIYNIEWINDGQKGKINFVPKKRISKQLGIKVNRF